jgi:uncharacterized protein (TIGR01244 family)
MKALLAVCLCVLISACAPHLAKQDALAVSPSIQTLLEQRLITSGQPGIEDLDRLQAQGVTTVISLRTETETVGYDEAAEADKRGMRFIALPINGKTDITFAKAEELNQILEQTDGKILLHCASGNRVGALVALIADKQGNTPEQSLVLGKQSGLSSLEKTVEPLLQTKCVNC